MRTISSLTPADDRSVTMNVAGPGALIVAKAHKISERTTKDDRVRDKDALDVYLHDDSLRTRRLVVEPESDASRRRRFR